MPESNVTQILEHRLTDTPAERDSVDRLLRGMERQIAESGLEIDLGFTAEDAVEAILELLEID